MKKFLNLLGQLIFLNLLFIISSIPVITFGAGISSCYEVIKMWDKDIEINIITFYFQKFKRIVKKVLVLNIIMLILGILFIIIFIFLWNQEIILAKIMLFPFLSSFLIILMTMSYYYYYVIDKIEEKNLDIIKYSFFKSLINIKKSFIILLYPILIIILFILYNIYIWEFIIVIGFGVGFYINFKILRSIY